MKVDANQALTVAQGILTEQINAAADAQETEETGYQAVKELVKAGHNEAIIKSTLTRMSVDLTPQQITEFVQKAQIELNPPLPPGESQPVGGSDPVVEALLKGEQPPENEESDASSTEQGTPDS